MKHAILIVSLVCILIIRTSSSSYIRESKNLKMKQESKEVLSFLRTAHVFKAITNLFYGGDLEIKATLNEIFAMISKVSEWFMFLTKTQIISSINFKLDFRCNQNVFRTLWTKVKWIRQNAQSCGHLYFDDGTRLC